MHRLAWMLAALAATAAPATAGTILYATAATPGRINGFCVGTNGALAPEPRVTIDTVGLQPSRVVASQATLTLYVAENDRIEVFKIAPDGSLTRPTPNHVPKPVENGINSHDVLLDCPPGDAMCVPTTLYVPERRAARVVTFPLGPDGVPTSQAFTSCALGDAQVGFEYLVRHQPSMAQGSTEPAAPAPPVLYASQTFESNDSGAIAVYELDQQGQIVGDCVLDDDPANGDDPNNCNQGETANRVLDPDGNPVTDENGNPIYTNDNNGDGVCDDNTTISTDDVNTVVRCVSPIACGLPPQDPPPQCPALGAPVTCPDEWFPCPENTGRPCACCRRTGQATSLRTGPPGTIIVPLPATNDQLPPTNEAALRRGLPGAGSMVLQPNPPGTVVSECESADSPFRLIVESRFAKRLQAFNLRADGNFGFLLDRDSCQPKLNNSGDEIPRQRAATKTKAKIRYQDLKLAGSPTGALLATDFIDGRIDAYRITQQCEAGKAKCTVGALSGQPKRTTRKNVRTSPVRMTLHQITKNTTETDDDEQVLYVGSGQFDRVDAYKLRRNGLPDTKEPFSSTNGIPGSFPNDVVLVTVDDACN